MNLELQDRVAVVTGAGKGSGRAVVDALLAEGALVVAGARHVDSLAGIDRVVPLAVDLAEPDGPGRLVALARERHGRVDVLVNNVGAAPIRLDGFLALADADFNATMQRNFYAALRATRAAVADMRGEPGAIVNVASQRVLPAAAPGLCASVRYAQALLAGDAGPVPERPFDRARLELAHGRPVGGEAAPRR